MPLPRHLIIEITSYCNLKCRMCPKTHHAVNTAENQQLSWDVFERLIPLFPHIESLDLCGIWGEAFMHPDLYVRMLKTIKGHGTDVYTTSNGTLISDDLARQLVEFDLNKLMVSLDAATPETYAKVRPPGRFEDVVEGLDRIRHWKKEFGHNQPRVELGFVGMRMNIEEFPDAVRLAHRLGAAQVNLQAMGEYPGLENESIAAHDKERGRRIFEEARGIGRERGLEVVLLPPDQFEEDRQARNELCDTDRYQKHCGDLWNRALIAANGDVLPCCAATESLGNLLEQPFRKIWRGPAYTSLRRKFLSGTPPPMCRECTGMGWIERSVRHDLDFYFADLMAPRVKRRMKRKLRQVPPLRWAKRTLDHIRGKDPA